jgi:hypothetical protein
MPLHRAQVAPRLADLVEGQAPIDNYFMYDSLENRGFFVKQSREDWESIEKLYLVNTIGMCISLCECDAMNVVQM